MDDGIPPASGPRSVETPVQENPLHQQADPVKPIKGKGHRPPSSVTLGERTAASTENWRYTQYHLALLNQKQLLSCQKVFADSLEEIRSVMVNHVRQSQHFRISYLDDSGKKITVIPPDPALMADPERLQELMDELDLELEPLERQLKPKRATIHKRLDNVEQALNTSKAQLQNQGLPTPCDPGTPNAFFLGKELLDIPDPKSLPPTPWKPENQAQPRPKKEPHNRASRENNFQAENTRRQPRSNTPLPPPLQKDKGFEFSTRPAKGHRANDPDPARKHSKPPQNAQTRTKAENVREVTPHPPAQVKPKTVKAKGTGPEKDVLMTQPLPYEQGSGDTQQIAERIEAIRELNISQIIRDSRPKVDRATAIQRINNRRSDQRELKMTMQWLEFYRSGKTKIDSQKWTLNEILAMNGQELEQKHDFIQLLFPRPSFSANNAKAPLITVTMVEAINSTPKIQQKIKKSMHKMLGFWGIQWQEATNGFALQPNNQPGLQKWCGAFDHNHQRITRLFEFLVAVGWIDIAQKLEAFMNDYRTQEGTMPELYWQEVIGLTKPDRSLKVKQPAPAPVPPVIKPKVPPKPTALQWPRAQPASRYEARGINTNVLYHSRSPFPQRATLERWQTPGGAGTAAWQIHSDPTFNPQHHKVGVVVAGNHGLPLGGLADSNGLKKTVTPEKLQLTTQEETITANCILTTCGENRRQQDQWVANTVHGRWGLKQPVYNSQDTMTLQGIDYTQSKNPDDYADAWVVSDASLSAVTGQQLVPGTRVKADLIFSAGPNANKNSGDSKGSMKRTLNRASLGNFPHFRECVKCTVRAALDGAANAKNTHVLLAPISCGVYAGEHKDKMTDEAFNAIVNEVLNEHVGPQGEQRSAYFVKVIVSGIRTGQREVPIKSYQEYMKQYSYSDFRKNPTTTHIGFYHRTDKSDDYYEFTNFWPTEKPLVIDGHPWRTTEHYFQACKFAPGSEEWINIQQKKTVKMTYTEKKTGKWVTKEFDLRHPGQVFSYIRAIMDAKPVALQYTNNQWSNIKDQVMLKALRAKAQQSHGFRQLLSKSDQKPLFETSDKDDYWGTGKHHNGQNRLGALLMQVRDEVKARLLPEQNRSQAGSVQ